MSNVYIYEKLYSFSQALQIYEKYGLLSAAQFVHMKGLGGTDTLLTIPYHLQKSLDAGMESFRSRSARL